MQFRNSSKNRCTRSKRFCLKSITKNKTLLIFIFVWQIIIFLYCQHEFPNDDPISVDKGSLALLSDGSLSLMSEEIILNKKHSKKQKLRKQILNVKKKRLNNEMEVDEMENEQHLPYKVVEHLQNNNNRDGSNDAKKDISNIKDEQHRPDTIVEHKLKNDNLHLPHTIAEHLQKNAIRRGSNDVNTSVIFISLASYCDRECAPTVSDAYRKAKYPERIRIGIYQQNRKQDTDCIAFELECPYHFLCKFRHYIQIERVSEEEATGPVTARYAVDMMVTDEDFFLQVDSHTVFVKNWDIKIINQWNAAENEYAVLTTYPSGVKESMATLPPPRMICSTRFQGENDQFMLKHSRTIDLPIGKKPFLAGYTAAGFMFHKAHRVKIVPNDKYAYNLFDGEEFSMGVRMFTWGYDFYAPAETLVTHKYFDYRNPKPRFWDSNWDKKFPLQKKSRFRMWAAIGYPISDTYDNTELERFSVGSYRTVKSYVDWLGIDIEKYVINHNFCSKWQSLERVPGLPGQKLPLDLLNLG